jgi:hypothetical protein
MTEDNVVTHPVVVFVTKASEFLERTCVAGSAKAVPRSEVAEAGGLSKGNDALISQLIDAGLMPGWEIRLGRDGGVARVGEVRVKGSKASKLAPEFLTALNFVLNQHVPLDTKQPTNRNSIAKELVKHLASNGIEEDVLVLPARISEAIAAGLCDGFVSRRGSGIFRTSALATEVATVSADGLESHEEMKNEAKLLKLLKLLL